MANLIRFLFLSALGIFILNTGQLAAQTSGSNVSGSQLKREASGRDKLSPRAPVRSKSPAQAVSSKESVREHAILDLPGYPKYVSTGNAKADEKNYQIAKEKWMREHPGEYRRYIENARKGQPSVQERRKQNKL